MQIYEINHIIIIIIIKGIIIIIIFDLFIKNYDDIRKD